MEHELAVPDGMEGVEPVRVPAPPISPQHIHIRDVSEACKYPKLRGILLLYLL